MAELENTGLRDQKYAEWHRSLPHNHYMLDFDMLDLMNRTLFGIFSGIDKDRDDVCKCLFECKEIQYSGGYYFLPYIDKNQAGCLRSFCKRYDENGVRNDIPFFVVCYSIDIKKDERWFVVHAVNDACHQKLKDFTKTHHKTYSFSEKGYIKFLSHMIDKTIYRSGSSWTPNQMLIDDRKFKNSIV
jgi:hypothetical protein